MPPDAQTVDTVVAIIAVGALLIGLISMGVGKAVEGYDRARAWWQEGIERAQSVNDFDDEITSSDDGSDEDVTGSGTGSQDAVPGQQHRSAPGLVSDFDAAINVLSKHKLESPEQLIDALSVLHFENGYVFSANKIRDLVGGNEAAVKAQVAAHRPKIEAPKPSPRLDRPENGWR